MLTQCMHDLKVNVAAAQDLWLPHRRSHEKDQQRQSNHLPGLFEKRKNHSVKLVVGVSDRSQQQKRNTHLNVPHV